MNATAISVHTLARCVCHSARFCSSPSELPGLPACRLLLSANVAGDGRSGLHDVCDASFIRAFDHDGKSWLHRCVSPGPGFSCPQLRRLQLRGFQSAHSGDRLLCALCRTGLVVGPKKQLKSMAKPDRIACAVAFVFFFLMTIVTVFSSDANFVVVLFFACCQLGAYIYYVLSYVPYGRKGAQKLGKMAFGVRFAPSRLALLLR